MLRFNDYSTNTLAEMFDHIKDDARAAGLTLHSEDASSLILTDGKIYIAFKNVTTYMYFSASFENTFNGNYLNNYFVYYNSANNFYNGSVYNMYLCVVQNGTDYGIGMFKTNAALNNMPIQLLRVDTTERTLYMYGTGGSWATMQYIDTDGITIGVPAHQIETLKITEQDYLYKRNLNVTAAGGYITDNEFFKNLYDACFPGTMTNTRCTWEMNDGKYVSISSTSTANQYLFKYE